MQVCVGKFFRLLVRLPGKVPESYGFPNRNPYLPPKGPKYIIVQYVYARNLTEEELRRARKSSAAFGGGSSTSQQTALQQLVPDQSSEKFFSPPPPPRKKELLAPWLLGFLMVVPTEDAGAQLELLPQGRGGVAIS